jgi:hypothetical protein
MAVALAARARWCRSGHRCACAIRGVGGLGIDRAHAPPAGGEDTVSSLSALEGHLRSVMPRLCGPWVKDRTDYGRALAACLDVEYAPTRYWDARWGGRLLKFKKGAGIWLDLVRYSEALVCLGGAAATAETLFFRPDARRECVVEVACVGTVELAAHLGLTDLDAARAVLALQGRVPRSLNAQASLTWGDVRRLHRFGVRRDAAPTAEGRACDGPTTTAAARPRGSR